VTDKLKPISDYKSFWDWSLDRSNYHYNKWQEESPGSLFKVLGRLENTWADELPAIKERSFVATQNNITYTGNQKQAGIANTQRKYDYEKFGGGGNIDKIEMTNIVEEFENFPNVLQVINYFGLSQVQARCHVQLTGQMFTIHIDPLKKLFAGPAATDYDADYGYDPADIVRLTVMLEDWEPGQFFAYGNSIYKQWRAGDFHIHDWPNAPHATANASMHSRTTLQLTGLRTELTDSIIGKTRFNCFKA